MNPFRRQPIPRVALIVALAAGTACQARGRPGEAPLAAIALPDRVTGANIRAVGDDRRGYGTKKARETMRRLRRQGVNTLSVLMEGRMDGLHGVEVRPPDRETLDDLRAVLLDANRMGFATVLIPHLYLDDGHWRGQITLEGRGQRPAWWRSYAQFIEVAATIAVECGVTVLSIGVELKALSGRPETRLEMAALRDRVRKVFRGLVTYSANWDEAEDVVFWDLFDLVGINGYYPLVPDPVRGAEAVARRMSALHRRTGIDVIVLEVGYRAGPMSHVRPWEWPEEVIQGEVDEGAQARAWAAVLSSWLDAPGVRGLLVWVVPTDPDDPASEPAHGFNPLNRPAETIIRRAFLGTGEDAS